MSGTHPGRGGQGCWVLATPAGHRGRLAPLPSPALPAPLPQGDTAHGRPPALWDPREPLELEATEPPCHGYSLTSSHGASTLNAFSPAAIPPYAATQPPHRLPRGHPQRVSDGGQRGSTGCGLPSLSTALRHRSGGHNSLHRPLSWADVDLGHSSAGLRQRWSSASSTDTASSLSSHSSEDRSPPSPCRDTKVRDLRSAQRPGLGRGTQLCLPIAPGLRPLTVVSVTQHTPSPPTGEVGRPSCSAGRFSKRKLPAFTPEVTSNSPSSAKGRAGVGGVWGAGHPHTPCQPPTDTCLTRGGRGERNLRPPAPCTGWCWQGMGARGSPASCCASA